MTRRLSIFSFNTLRASFRPGTAVMVAVVCILLAEAGVRRLTPNLGWYEGLSSLGQWVGRLHHELKVHQPDTWLMGNSVLAYGVDIRTLEKRTGRKIAAMPFGGATVAGSTAMLEYYLKRAPRKPKHVVYCITKDDLNLHGERAWISTKYTEYDSWKGLTFDRIFRLADSRNTIMNHIKSLLPGAPAAADLQPSEPPFDGQVPEEKLKYLETLMRQYEFDAGAFQRARDLAERYGYDVSVVLMPVTDVYMNYHDRHSLRQSCAEVHQLIGESARAQGFAFHDLSGMDPGRYAYFSDPYHLTPEGRQRATREIAAFLGLRPRRENVLRVACIGDSITYGSGLPDRYTQAYPAVLENLAGGRIETGNFGVPSTTLLRNSGRAWMDTPALAEALAFNPHVIVIMFGINDSAHPDLLDQYEADGRALIARFRSLPALKNVILCTPTPEASVGGPAPANPIIRDRIIPQIRRLAEKEDAGIADIFAVFPRTRRYLPDTVHPNADGAGIIARQVDQILKPLLPPETGQEDRGLEARTQRMPSEPGR